MFLDRIRVLEIKELFPEGTRVRLGEMVGESPSEMKEGLQGTVQYVDDAGHIHVIWDNKSSLSLIFGVDNFTKIEEDV